MIRNTDQRSKDYGDIAEKFRPGHADITYWQKYGIRDYRGGGRSSARETAARVAAGGVARAALATLAPGLSITGYMVQMGPHGIDRDRFDWDQIEQNPFWTPDAQAATDWADYLDTLRKSGDSVGAIIEVTARGVPAGLGAPVYGKLDTDLAAAMMSINAVKGVEIGDGMAAAALTGSANADEIAMGPDGPEYSSNHAGGILGGISTGQDVVLRFAVKPTSSILTPRKTITKSRRGDRDRHQGPPRSLRRHPCRPGGRGDDGLRPARPHAAASRACRRKPGPHRIGGPPRRPQSGPAPIIPSPDCRHIRFGSSVSHLICLERGA
jgi:chorismate synthase